MVQNISRNVEQEEQQDKAEMADFRSQLGMGLSIFRSFLSFTYILFKFFDSL